MPRGFASNCIHASLTNITCKPRPWAVVGWLVGQGCREIHELARPRARESRIGRKCFAQHPNQSTLSARHLGCPVQIAKLSVFWLQPMLCAEVEHRRQCMVRLASREVVALARPLAAAARIPVWASPRFFLKKKSPRVAVICSVYIVIGLALEAEKVGSRRREQTKDPERWNPLHPGRLPVTLDRAARPVASRTDRTRRSQTQHNSGGDKHPLLCSHGKDTAGRGRPAMAP